MSSRGVLIGVGLCAVLAYGTWSAFFETSNEIGPVGADWAGRQVFLQSWDHYMAQTQDSSSRGFQLHVTSEFDKTPFLVRFLQRPMRTTIVLSYVLAVRKRPYAGFLDSLLNAPSETLVSQYRDSISLREDQDIPVDSLRSRLRALGVVTVGQFFAALGFRHLELDVNGHKMDARELPVVGRGNVKWAGS